MDGTPAVATRLAEHDTALRNLLESLLAEIPVADPDSVCQPPVAAIGRRTPVLSPEPAINEHRGEPLTTLSGPVPLPQTAVPAWAGQSFPALVFEVGDQRLAMPLILMRSIGLLDAPLTGVSGLLILHHGTCW